MGARGWILTAVAVAVIGGGGALLYFNSKDNTTPAPEVNSTTIAPATGLTKDRLDEIAATINKQEPTAEKLKSQASAMVSVLRENFIKQGTPLENITFGDSIDARTRSAQANATGASGATYRITLVYVADPASSSNYKWLILYVEGGR
jgi:hypothetical protein